MEFLLGSVVTTIILYAAMKYFEKLYLVVTKDNKYKFNQSSLHELVKPLLPEDLFIPERKITQSFLHEQKTNMRVIILDGFAYWIKDNTFYRSEMDGFDIRKDSAEVVDIMGLNKVQLDKMIFIIDKLREGLPNDSWSTGNE
jgi:hypothetical protein